MKILLIIMASFMAFAALAQQQPSAKHVGAPLIPFAAEDMTGMAYSSDDLQGKVIVLNLWATFCKPCILEMPELNKVKQEYVNQDVVFISMTPEDKPTIRKFLKKHTFDFVVLPGSAGYMMNFGTSIPQTILIDKKGIVREVQNGTLPVDTKLDANVKKSYVFKSDNLKTRINELLSE